MLQPEIFDIDKPCYLQAKSLIKRCVRIEFDKLILHKDVHTHMMIKTFFSDITVA